MKKQYNKATFVDNFKRIIAEKYDVKAEDAKFIIKPNYDPTKSESGEDSVFRLVALSDDNVGGKKLCFTDTADILTMFNPHFPTNIVISKEPDDGNEKVFVVSCSTRVRKPSAIANIECEYAPFNVAQDK